MSRRLMLRNASGGGGILPPEYQQVEWIGSISGSYITLPDMNFTQNSVVKCLFRKTTAANSEEALFSAQGTKTCIEIGFLKGNKIFAYSANGTSSTITDSLIYNDWVDYTAVYQSTAPTKKATAIINGTTINGNDGSGVNATGSARCALFGIRSSPSIISTFCVAQLASLVLVLEGVLTLNLIPCYRKSDNIIGMYNTVSQTFFAGTGTFTKGADVN